MCTTQSPVTKYGGIAGYANYAPHRVANAFFMDAAKEYREAGGQVHSTRILLMAGEAIEAGCEIRVDYDRGVAGVPFRAQRHAGRNTGLGRI